MGRDRTLPMRATYFAARGTHPKHASPIESSVSADNPLSAWQPTPVLLRQDFVGGLVVIAVAVFAYWQGADLPLGTLGGVGPGMLPRGLAVLLALLGALLVLDSLPKRGRRSIAGRSAARCSCSARWSRSGLTMRPLGLVVAGPLAVIISAFASDEVRWEETLLFGALMTAFCIGLFKFALGLPIPLAPWLLGY